MSDREVSDSPQLPNRWQAIAAEQIYCSNEGRLVSFSQSQIKLGVLYDALGKHLRAINKGVVPPKVTLGLCLQKNPIMISNLKFLVKVEIADFTPK